MFEQHQHDKATGIAGYPLSENLTKTARKRPVGAAFVQPSLKGAKGLYAGGKTKLHEKSEVRSLTRPSSAYFVSSRRSMH